MFSSAPSHISLWGKIGLVHHWRLAAQDPIRCAQDAQRAPSGAPSPRWDRARRAEQFHVTWFTFGGGQIARGVTRSRRGIGATDPKPRALPACAYLTRQTQRVRTREGVNVSLVDWLKLMSTPKVGPSGVCRHSCTERSHGRNAHARLSVIAWQVGVWLQRLSHESVLSMNSLSH